MHETQRDYEQGIAALAMDIATEIADEYPKHESNRDAAIDALYDRTWERLDSHSWVIYTAKAQRVVTLSPNAGYAADEWGVDSILSDGCLNWSALAFGAMYADVTEALLCITALADGREWSTADPRGAAPDDA